MKKKKPTNRAKVIPLTARRREVENLVKFIDARAFRGYGARTFAAPRP